MIFLQTLFTPTANVAEPLTYVEKKTGEDGSDVVTRGAETLSRFERSLNELDRLILQHRRGTDENDPTMATGTD